MCLCFHRVHGLMGETHTRVMEYLERSVGLGSVGMGGNESCGWRLGTVCFLKQRQTRSGQPPDVHVTGWAEGLSPCLFHPKQDSVNIYTCSAGSNMPARAVLSRRWAVGQREWMGLVKLPGTVVWLWAGLPGPLALAAAPSFCFCCWDCWSGLS